MKRRFSFAIALSTIACSAALVPAPQAGTSAAITEADLRHRLFLIADDSMMGRESGSAGNFKTAAYVAGEFKRLGLEPAGENGTWFQTVPFWTAAIDPDSRIEVAGTPLQLGRDFVHSFANHTLSRQSATMRIQSGGKAVYLPLVTR